MKMMQKELVHCKNPDPDKEGTNVPRWKFETVRAAIIQALADSPDGVRFKTLPSLVRDHLSSEEAEQLGSISWHTTVVKLHLEAVAEIERVAGRRPQVIRAISR